MEKKGDSKKLTQDFKKIKGLINKYTIDFKIKGYEIYKFLNKDKNLNNFIKDNNLENSNQTKQIIKDIIENKKNKEKDMNESSIIKFEKFTKKLNESIIPEEFSTGIEHKKILADYFNTSVGHVQSIDEKNHFFLIDSFDFKTKAVCFSDTEFETIKENIVEKIINQIYNSELNISTIDNTYIPNGINFRISDIFSQDINLENFISEKQFYRIIAFILKYSENINLVRSIPTEHKRYLIWELPSEG